MHAYQNIDVSPTLAYDHARCILLSALRGPEDSPTHRAKGPQSTTSRAHGSKCYCLMGYIGKLLTRH